MKGHRGALELYPAIVAIADADVAVFWSAIPVQVRADALQMLDVVVAKLVKIMVDERLAAIGRAARGRRS